jgi:hypothetical protein
MRFLIVFFLSLFIAISAFCQIEIKGKLICKETNASLSFVNIGVLKQNIGTVSNENGFFSLKIPNQFINDSIRFSLLGYISKTFVVNELINSNDTVMYLEKNTYELSEVIIEFKKLKTKTIRNKIVLPGCYGSFDQEQLGHEVGILVKLKGKRSKIRDFSFFIENLCDDTLLFRVNIYKLKDSLPDENILRESVFVETTQKRGLVTVNLEKYNIFLNEDFVISLEWLIHFSNPCIFLKIIPMGLSTIDAYVKHASQGEWELVRDIGFDFLVTVLQ